MKKLAFALVALAATVAVTPKAWGGSIPIPAASFTLGTELATITGTLVSNGGAFPTYTATYTESVYKYGAGDLAFEYTVSDSGLDSIGSFSTNYGSAADPALSYEYVSGDTVAPTENQATGTVTVAFNGDLDNGASSTIILFTDAPYYTGGTITFLDSLPTSGPAYIPVITPEPGSLFLLGTGLLGLGLLARQKLTN